MNYTIKKVSEMTGLSIPTIRYYDNEGLLPDLQRKESGYRVFSDRDLEAIDLIHCFKESGLTIREIRHFMKLQQKQDLREPQRNATLPGMGKEMNDLSLRPLPYSRSERRINRIKKRLVWPGEVGQHTESRDKR